MNIFADSMVAIAGSVLGWAARTLFSGMRGVGRYEERFQDHGKRLDGHDVLHTQHQARFSTMHIDFVPRTELTDKIDDLRESQRRTEQLALSLVTGKQISPHLGE